MKDYTFYQDGVPFAIFPKNKDVDLKVGEYIYDADSDEKFLITKVENNEVYLESTTNE